MQNYNPQDWYEYNAQALDFLSKQKDLSIKLFTSQKCPDCQQWVNVIFTIAQKLMIPITITEVTMQKDDANGYAKKHQVTKIPTAILYQGEKEMGRIIEYPQTTCEEDFVKFLSN